MEENKEKQKEEDTSGNAAIIRGKKAIEADEEINKKNLAGSKIKEERSKDEEQWHNEG